MLRFGILASAVPLLIAGLFARGELAPGAQPCIALADHSVQLASSPWRAQVQVGFTDDPARASVRVQIVDNAAAADFAVSDDGVDAPSTACKVTSATRFVAIATNPTAAQPLILLTRDGDADYRIFVSSKSFSLRDAAALVVGAGDGHARITTASIGGGS
jgi:hypothetical protein